MIKIMFGGWLAVARGASQIRAKQIRVLPYADVLIDNSKMCQMGAEYQELI
jgi:hypothetical protein